MEDPNNKDRFPNEFNEYNSVVRIGPVYKFKLTGFTSAKKVILAGSFNNWRSYELVMGRVYNGWELPYSLGEGNYEYHFVVDGKVVADPANKEISVKGHSGNSYFVIGANYTFRLEGYGNAKSVFLAGDFNDWSGNTYAMKRVDDEWLITVHLMPGKHQYKFVVDGKWIIDPDNKYWEENDKGSGNSVMWFEPSGLRGF